MENKKPWWKWLLQFILGCALFLVSYVIISIPSSLKLPLWAFVIACVVVSALNLLLYALWWKWTEKEKAKDLPMSRLASHTGVGFGIGIFYFLIVTGVIALLGGYKVGGIAFDWRSLVYSLFSFLVVAVGEEVLFRGIVFRMLDRQWGTAVALILSALLFGFMHIVNDNATVWSSVAIAVEAGLLLGAAYKWSGSLWLPIGLCLGLVLGLVTGKAKSGGADARSIGIDASSSDVTETADVTEVSGAAEMSDSVETANAAEASDAAEAADAAEGGGTGE